MSEGSIAGAQTRMVGREEQGFALKPGLTGLESTVVSPLSFLRPKSTA
jgi:hypothetical protein